MEKQQKLQTQFFYLVAMEKYDDMEAVTISGVGIEKEVDKFLLETIMALEIAGIIRVVRLDKHKAKFEFFEMNKDRGKATIVRGTIDNVDILDMNEFMKGFVKRVENAIREEDNTTNRTGNERGE